MADAPRLRVFISSPGDVRPERLIARRVVERLDREFSAHVRLEPLLWERQPLVATRHFQDDIPLPSSTDVVVVVVWSRLGTKLPAPRFAGPITGASVTGTEWEFEEAYAAHLRQGHPDLLVYRKTAPVLAALGSQSEAEKRGQLAALAAFVQSWFENADGTLRAAHHPFASPSEFEDLLHGHLREWILRRLGDIGSFRSIRWHHGSPFRGLESFGPEHEAVFFGRTQARHDVREALVAQAERGCAMVLVLGASGSGKSSLLKAGLVPDLLLPGMLPNAGMIWWSSVRPGDTADPLMALAKAVTGALPETIVADAGALAAALRASPKAAARTVVASILEAAAHAQLAPPWQGRMLLLVDQLEEIFAEAIAPSVREVFLASLIELASAGNCWVLASMRSDFFPFLERAPALNAATAGQGRYVLAPPTEPEIGQIIRLPALEAGFTFETSAETGLPLDEALRQEASASAGALPLLEFTLEQLWQRRTEKGELTYSAYAGLGGLAGAIGTRAEQIFTSQPPDVQSALPTLLFLVTTVDQARETVTLGRSVARSALKPDTPEGRLANAFLAPEARLLVASGDSDGATVRVAHEALLLHWPRARQQIAQDFQDLRLRARLERAQALWQAQTGGAREGFLLNAGLPLSQAVDLLHRKRAELDAGLIAFIDASVARDQRRIQRLRAAAAGFAVLTLVASAGAWLGYRGERAAEQRLREAQTSESKTLAEQALQEDAAGDYDTALQTVLKGMPENLANPDWPIVPESFDALRQVMADSALQPGTRVMLTDAAVSGTATLSDSGDMVANISGDGSVQLWDVAAGSLRQTFQLPDSAYTSAVTFAPSGRTLILMSTDGGAASFDTTSGAPRGVVHVPGIANKIFTLATDHDGETVLLATDRTCAVYRLADAHRLIDCGTPRFSAGALSPDGTRAVTWDGATATLWNVPAGTAILRLPGAGVVLAAAFAPDGAELATGSEDGHVRIWNTGLGTLAGDRGNFGGPAAYVAYAHGGSYLLSAGYGPGNFTEHGAALAQQFATPLATKAAIVSPDEKTIALLSSNFTNFQQTRLQRPDGSLINAWQAPAEHIELFKVGSGTHIGSLHVKDNRLVGAAFSNEGRLVTVGTDVRRWSVEHYPALLTRVPGQNIIGGCLHQDGDGVTLFTETRDVLVRGLKDGQQTSSPVGQVRWLDTATGWFLTIDSRNTARIFDCAGNPLGSPLQSPNTQTNFLFSTLRQIPSSISAMWISPDKARIALTLSGATSIFDRKSGIPHTLNGDVTQLSFAQDGNRFAALASNGTFTIWEGADLNRRCYVRQREVKPIAMVMRAHNRSVVLGYANGEVRLVQLPDCVAKPFSRIVDGQGVSWLAAFPDGGIGAFDSDGHGTVWGANGEPLVPIKIPRGSHIATDTFGQHAVIFAASGPPSLVALRTGRVINLTQGHTMPIWSAAFNPAGTVLATASIDGVIMVWRTIDGSPIVKLHGSVGGENALSFSPDGQSLLITSPHADTQMVWHLLDDDAILKLARQKP